MSRFTTKRVQFSYVVLDDGIPLLSIFDTYAGKDRAEQIANELSNIFNNEIKPVPDDIFVTLEDDDKGNRKDSKIDYHKQRHGKAYNHNEHYRNRKKQYRTA